MARVPEIWKAGPSEDDRQFSADFMIEFEDQYALRQLRRPEFNFRRHLAFVTAPVLLAGLIIAYQQWQAGERLFAIGAIILVAPVSYILTWLTFGFVKGVEQGFWRGFFDRRGMINRPITLHMNASGYSMQAGSHSIHSGWDKIIAVEQDAERYFLLYERDYAYVVPKRGFEDGELSDLDQAMRDWCGGKFGDAGPS